MNLFKKIKSDLDKKIEDDKLSTNEKSTETFSVKSILDGRLSCVCLFYPLPI